MRKRKQENENPIEQKMFKRLSRIVFILMFLSLCFLPFSSSAQECGVIYCSASGATTGLAGTRANPADLDYGLTLVSSSAKRLWLATGTYNISATLVIPDSVTIEGGFNLVTWDKSNAAESIIARDNQNLFVANNALIGLGGINVNAFRLQDLTINIANAPGNGNSVYGIYLNGCANYNITRCKINAGAGAPGFSGIPGSAGVVGGNGQQGLPGNGNESVQPGGPGGAGVGGNDGGAGQQSGKHSGSTNPGPGQTGLPTTCGGTGGATGSGPQCSSGCFFGDPSCGSVTPGQNGNSGGTGISGNAGTGGPLGSIIGGFWVPGGSGGNGTDGANGCGGGGGGGGGGRQRSGSDDVGGSGGGGGGGGGGGTGGIGGSGGGSSYAVFLISNGTGGIIQDCELIVGAAGAGGAGGAGGTAGTGGAGGAGGAAGPCGNSYGGAGGAGGAGGQGGIGGTGAAGESIQLQEISGTPVAQLGITAVPGNPPVITVENRGCIGGEVIFLSPSSGNWNFGTGAVPAIATGTGPFSVTYSSIGRKTIVFSGTSFTDYIDVFSNGPGAGTITPANGTVTLGCPNSFTTSLTGSFYEWIFPPSATPDTVQGPSMQTASGIYFGATGTYTIKLWVTTPCCGRVLDSTIVTVTSSSFNVSLTATPSTACAGSPIVFSATPNTYAGYSFLVNNIPVQTGPGSTFTTTTLQAGDSVVVSGLVGTCFTNPSAVIYPTINPIPTVSLTSSDVDNIICDGESITFTATPSGYANYEFFDGSTSVYSGTNNFFSTTTLTSGNSITVVATNLNCSSPASNAIVTVVNPLPIITLTSSDLDNIICAGDTVIFTVSPSGVANYDFSIDGSSVQSGNLNTYTTFSLTNGNIINVVATSSAGCAGPVSNAFTFTVNPIPVISTFTTSDDSICPAEVVIFTVTPGGNSNYEFFDNALSVQSSSSATFSTTTLSPGNNITVVASNLGCSSPVSDTLSIYIFPTPTVTLTSSDIDNTICDGDPVTFTASPPGIANYEFFVNGVSTQNGTIATYTTSSLVNGDNITVVGTDFGCPGLPSNAIIFTVNPIPVISVAASSSTICQDSSVTFTASPSSYNNYEFFVNGVAVQSGTGFTFSSNTITNTDAITVIATDLGCVSSLSNSVSITVNPTPTVTLSGFPSPICQGDSVGFMASPAGYDNYEFFNGTSSLQSNSTNIFITTSLTSSNNITVVATNLGCPSPPSNSISITVNPLPNVSISGNTIICNGQATTLTTSNGNAYDWSTGETTNPITVSPSITTNYSVTVTDGNGCKNSAPITVTVIQINFVSAGSNVIVCNNNGVQMNATAGFTTYQWIPAGGLSDPNISNPIANPDTTTAYSVIFTDANGCQDTAYVTATPSVATADAGPDVIINYGQENPLAASGAASHLWSPSTGLSCTNCQTPIAGPTATTTYLLTVITADGCSATDSVTVEVIISTEVFVPDAFSPNGDGENDILFARGPTIAELYFSIYDRWGKKVFETKDKNIGWDGKINGQNAEAAVYVYVLYAKIVNGFEVQKKGDVILVR